jgi:hypothetical protein
VVALSPSPSLLSVAASLWLQESLERLQGENERLRRDNERFVRLIDSGEWGRGRVAELAAAGEAMQSERDALLQLVASLRREYEAVQAARGANEQQLRVLQDRAAHGVRVVVALHALCVLAAQLLLLTRRLPVQEQTLSLRSYVLEASCSLCLALL